MDDLKGRAISPKRFALGALGILPAIGLAATLVERPPLLLLWNVSASVPIGLYRVHEGASPAKGDMVAALAPEPFGSLAAARDYLPRGVLLVKRVAATNGDLVCARDDKLQINGRFTALLLSRDGAGRPLPRWQGCRTLRSGEFYLLGDNPRSFDSRYFAPVGSKCIIGTAVMLWRR